MPGASSIAAAMPHTLATISDAIAEMCVIPNVTTHAARPGAAASGAGISTTLPPVATALFRENPKKIERV